MGTTWTVTVVTSAAGPGAGLQEAIDLRLEELNRQLSTWIDDSEISRFNRHARVGEPFPVSRDFVAVMATAEDVYTLSGGAWDGTVGPAVALWGFGPRGPALASPSPESVAAALATVGFGENRDAAVGRAREARPRRHPRPVLDRQGVRRGRGRRGRAGARVRRLPGRDRRRGPGLREPARRTAVEGGHQSAGPRRRSPGGVPDRPPRRPGPGHQRGLPQLRDGGRRASLARHRSPDRAAGRERRRQRLGAGAELHVRRRSRDGGHGDGTGGRPGPARETRRRRGPGRAGRPGRPRGACHARVSCPGGAREARLTSRDS